MANLLGNIGNNILSPTSNGDVARGLGGNDTYIISSAIEANATIQIIDTEAATGGFNRVQLVDGLTITSSKFFADAVELVLSNGAKVQVLGASKFKFDIGANATSGDNVPLPGTVLASSYADFAKSLGLAALPTGSASASGTANFSIVAATYAVAATSTSVDEGKDATFTVTTTNVKDGTVLAYTLGGTNNGAADFTAPNPLSVTITNNTGTITVPLLADKLTEATAETLSVTLAADTTKTASVTINDTSKTPTYAIAAAAAAVDEGKDATFTVTTTNVADNTELDFTLGGTNNGAADYTVPTTLKVKIVGNTGTIAIPLLADKLTEATAETLSVTLAADTTKTASVTINDTSMTPTYAIAAAAAAVDEGKDATFTVTTTNVADNTELDFTLGGTNNGAADYTAPATMKVKIVGNTGTITIPLLADKLTEATAETLSVTLTADTTKTASVTINDTSKAGGAVAVSAAGSQDASGGDYTFNVAAGNYTYTISKFEAGDKIAVFSGAAVSIVPDSNDTDGLQSYALVDSNTGGTVTIELTGLSAAQDAALFNVSSFNTTFGAGSLA